MVLLLPLLGFFFVALLVAGFAMAMAPARGGLLEQRLGELRGFSGVVAEEPSRYSETFKKSFKRLSTYAPTSPAETAARTARFQALRTPTRAGDE